MNFYGRLKTLIEKEEFTISSFEAEMKFSNASLHKAMDQKRGINSDRIEKIFSRFPHWNAEWLFKARGEMYVKGKKGRKEAEDSTTVNDLRKTIKAMEKVINFSEEKNAELERKLRDAQRTIQQIKAHQRK
jgi:hypothetical protein